MKRILLTALLLLTAALMITSPGYADPATIVASGICGEDAVWSVDSGGVLRISGTGMVDAYYTEDEEGYGYWWRYEDDITQLEIEDGITGIDYDALRDLTSMTTAFLPATLEEIHTPVFANCPSLENIFVDGANPTFYDDDGVLYAVNELYRYPPARSDVWYCTREDCWGSIYEGAFYGAQNLERLYIREVSNIEFPIFGECDNLLDIYMGGDEEWMRSWQDSMESDLPYGNQVVFHYNATAEDCQQGSTTGSETGGEGGGDGTLWYEGSTAHGNCGTNLKWAFYDSGLLYILGTGAMEDYFQQTDYHYDSSGQRIDVTYYTYPWRNYANRITRLYVESGVTNLGNMAFTALTSLKMASLPRTLTSVDYGAFHQTGLTDVYYEGDSGEWSYVSRGQYNAPLNNATFHWLNTVMPDDPGQGGDDPDPVEPAILTLPANLKRVEASAFEGGTFTEVHMGSQVTSIGSRAFADCENLGLVEIGSRNTQIADDAFDGISWVVFACYEGSTAADWAEDHGFGVSYIGE